MYHGRIRPGLSLALYLLTQSLQLRVSRQISLFLRAGVGQSNGIEPEAMSGMGAAFHLLCFTVEMEWKKHPADAVVVSIRLSEKGH